MARARGTQIPERSERIAGEGFRRTTEVIAAALQPNCRGKRCFRRHFEGHRGVPEDIPLDAPVKIPNKIVTWRVTEASSP